MDNDQSGTTESSPAPSQPSQPSERQQTETFTKNYGLARDVIEARDADEARGLDLERRTQAATKTLEDFQKKHAGGAASNLRIPGKDASDDEISAFRSAMGFDTKVAAIRATDAYRKAEHPGHAQAVREVTKLFEAQYNEPGETDAANEATRQLPYEELKKISGVTFDWPQATEAVRDHMANAMAFGISEGIPASTLNRLAAFTHDKLVLHGNSMKELDYLEFKQRFSTELTPAQMKLFRRWYREEIMGYAREDERDSDGPPRDSSGRFTNGGGA